VQEQSNTVYKEKRRCAVTIKYGDNKKFNKNYCNKRGLEKRHQWRSCITTDYDGGNKK
jgi:hypothetical protein